MPEVQQSVSPYARDLQTRDARGQISEIQRTRIVTGMVDAAAERGIGNVTIAQVVERAGVSRRTFYELFESREDCFLAAFEDSVARLAGPVVDAYRKPREWRRKMRDAVLALLTCLEEDPDVGRVAIVEALAAGPTVLQRRSEVLAALAAAVDRGREASRGQGPLPPLLAESIVGGALALIHTRLTGEELSNPLLEMVNPLVSMIVLPYLGAQVASQELTRPVAPDLRPGGTLGLASLRDLEMRLTYRTVRVLLEIGRRPQASNRQVADAADIRDQGQVSKLLMRLGRLGLIQNLADGQSKGEPNSWMLTRRGEDVREAIVAQRLA